MEEVEASQKPRNTSVLSIDYLIINTIFNSFIHSFIFNQSSVRRVHLFTDGEKPPLISSECINVSDYNLWVKPFQI